MKEKEKSNNNNPKIYDCWDVLKEYFTKEEIKEAKEIMVACGCSVCLMIHLTDKFSDRVPKEKRFCFGM